MKDFEAIKRLLKLKNPLLWDQNNYLSSLDYFELGSWLSSLGKNNLAYRFFYYGYHLKGGEECYSMLVKLLAFPEAKKVGFRALEKKGEIALINHYSNALFLQDKFGINIDSNLNFSSPFTKLRLQTQPQLSSPEPAKEISSLLPSRR